MSQRNVHIVSSSIGSIGEITKDLTIALHSEFDVTVEGEEEPREYDILLCHFISPEVTKNKIFKEFKHKILIQPIDGTAIQKEFIGYFNQYDLIVTPGEAGKKIMIANGVIVPILVIPNYYKAENLGTNKLRKIKHIPWDKFVFYHESTFHARKGIELLYEGYIRAFSGTPYADKVLLVLKDMPFNKLTFERIEKLKADTIKLQKEYKTPASIVKISQTLDWNKMQDLWNRADAYVSFAKIEGFGIPMLRFAALGKSIVTLDSKLSGYMDFLNSRNSYLVPTQQIKAVGEHMAMYTEDTQWSVAKIEDISKAMLNCYIDSLNVTQKHVWPADIKYMEHKNVMKSYVELLKSLN